MAVVHALQIEIAEPEGAPVRTVTLYESTVFGRECEGIDVADLRVSREHLEIQLTPAGPTVVDLGATNGTQVNGEPVSGSRVLVLEDVILLGQTELRVQAFGSALPLVEIREPGITPWHLVITESVELGRDSHGGLDLADPSMSARHLSLSVQSGWLVAEDLGSTNGTTANGSAISAPVRLSPGDWLGAGECVLVVVEPTDPTATPVDVRQALLGRTAPTESRPTVPTSASADPPATPPLPTSAAVPPAAVPPVAAPPAAATPTPDPTPAAAPPVFPTPTAQPTPPTAPAPTPAPAATPGGARTESISGDNITVTYRPGTHAERVAKDVLQASRRARKKLAGFGSEGWGTLVTIRLDDSIADPDGGIAYEGTVIDSAAHEIRMVATAESPPERPERPLALLFGAALPAGDEVAALVEGYGLHLADAPDPDEFLRMQPLPPLMEAGGELAAAMSLSLVRFLIDRDGVESLLRVLGTTQPGRFDAAAEEAFGMQGTALEMNWRHKLAMGGQKPKPTKFISLSWRYLKIHKWRQAEIFVYMLFALAFTTVFPFASRELFDKALPSLDYSEVTRILTGLTVAFVISLLAGLRQNYLTAFVSSSVVRDLRREIFDKVQFLPNSWFAHHDQGDVLTRLFSDVGEVESGLSQTLSQGVFQILTLVVSATIMMTLDPVLGAVVLVGAPLVGLVYKAMGNGAQSRSMAVQEETSGLMGVAAENYQAQDVVKVFGLQYREADRFDRRAGRLFKSERRLTLFGGLFGLSVNMIVTLLRIAVLALGSWLIIEGEFTLGGLVAFLGVMGEVINPVTTLTSIGQALQSATGALSRIDEVLDEPSGVETPSDLPVPGPLTSAIGLQGLTFSYTSDRRTLDEVSVTIPAGAKVAFVGPSGSGKSTVLRLLMRLYEPDSGSLTWDGVEVSSLSTDGLRNQLGVVFQDNFLFGTTVRENIELGRPGATEEEIVAAAQAAEVHDFIMQMPRGYDTLVGERGALLSGGQRQRVAIARALVRNPSVLLLDEATSALDPRTERQITATLSHLSEGRTTIAITHRLTSVVDYDRIFVIVDGRLAEQGSHEELVAHGGVYAGLWAEQTGQVLVSDTDLDLADMLRRVPIFASLPAEALEGITGLLQSADVPAGGEIPDGSGSLVFVARGRAEIQRIALGANPVVTAELGIGDSFGLAALRGQPSGLTLVARSNLRILVLNDEAMAALVARHPEVGAALSGEEARPEGVDGSGGGRRLSRVTFMGEIASLGTTSF